MDHDLAGFAVDTICRWWGMMGQRRQKFHGDWNYKIQPRNLLFTGNNPPFDKPTETLLGPTSLSKLGA